MSILKRPQFIFQIFLFPFWAWIIFNTPLGNPIRLNFLVGSLVAQLTLLVPLRIPDSHDAKMAKICNLWRIWPVIQPINNLFKRWFISEITVKNVQMLQIFAILAS